MLIGGDDFKSGQTKMKSVLVDFLVGAGLKPTSIVSYNHLGNNDGMNLSAPQTFRSKEISKSNVVRRQRPSSCPGALESQMHSKQPQLQGEPTVCRALAQLVEESPGQDSLEGSHGTKMFAATRLIYVGKRVMNE